jgi:rubrerythrin
MKSSTVLRWTGSSLLLCSLLLTSATATRGEEAKKDASTLDNLQIAYNGESNAHARYLAFAKKADEEGYTKAASLFRAAARAEEVHAQHHAEVIKKMGGTPKADVKAPEVKSTRENLEAAVKGESYERDVMYPEFIKQARAEHKADAVLVFNYAKTAEAEHARFYGEALANLSEWKGGTKDFYVCSVCGYTTLALPAEKCVSCFSPKEKYEKVS